MKEKQQQESYAAPASSAPQSAPQIAPEEGRMCQGKTADAENAAPAAQTAPPQGPQGYAPHAPQGYAPQGYAPQAPQGYAPQAPQGYGAPAEAAVHEHCQGNAAFAAHGPTVYGSARPVYGQHPGMPFAQYGPGMPNGAFSGPPPGFDPAAFAAQFGLGKPEQLGKRYEQMMDLCNDLMQGKTDPMKIAGLLSSSGSHFWKGAIVGVLLALILNSGTLKSALGDNLSSLFGAAGAEDNA